MRLRFFERMFPLVEKKSLDTTCVRAHRKCVENKVLYASWISRPKMKWVVDFDNGRE